MSPAQARYRRWQERRTATASREWRGSDALRRGLVVGVGLVVAGVVLHELAAVLVGAPLLVSTAVSLAAPVGRRPSVRVRPLPRTVESGQRARLLVDVDPGPGAELLAIRLPRPNRRGFGPVYVVPAAIVTLATDLRWDAWGDQSDFRLDHLVAGPDGLWTYGPVLGEEGRRAVLPPVLPMPGGPVPPRSAGLVGAHRSRRPGDGIELRDVRAYQPGDRLRGVDWRTTLRAGAGLADDGLDTLFVRERHAEADADVVLAVDTRVDVGTDLGDWSTGEDGLVVRQGGSLDRAAVAATALAAGYLHQGDRVGLVDLGRPQFGLRSGSGRRQLLVFRHRLLACVRAAGWVSRPALRTEQVPHGALVIVLSPFLDDAVVEQTLLAARRGSLVLAVDVLPRPLLPDPEHRWGGVVAKVIAAEQANRLAALRSRGVPVVSWVDGSEVVAVLRRAAAPGRRPAGRR
ncbi:MAG TPA: DUF58 domain-containing protein [Pseudonocardiaceae bacterium]|nr:DUF58 domain-containing protein [Pseudonocardiaceae bacterium]